MLNYDQVKELLLTGKTLQEVATIVGVSKQRIGQLKKKFNLQSGTYGASLRVANAKKVKQEKHKSLFKTSWQREEFDKICYELFTRKRANNKQRKWEWAITYPEIVFPEICPVLGKPLDYYADKRNEWSPSFDRTDPSKGYVSGNVQIISWRANRIKNDGTAAEHAAISAYLDKQQENNS